MKTFIINIGDELLIGQIVNTNASWMAEELSKSGIEVKDIVVISDNEGQILNTLEWALNEADVILITGGLGPTKDDVTKKTLCTFFNSEMIEDAASLHNIEQLFAKRGYPLTPTNRQQALVPACCNVIVNPLGTAPAMWFEKEGKIIISMPGVPYEMKAIMNSNVIPMLTDRFQLPSIIHKNILTFGIGESFLSDLIEEWELALPSNLSLAYLPNFGMVLLRLSGKGNEKTLLEEQMNKEINKLHAIAGKYSIGEGEDTLEKVLAKLLTDRNSSIGIAESCTGGNIAHVFTSMPGASAYLKGSVVAYDNSIKERVLLVCPETLEQYGAVSEETAREMALGALKLLDTTYAIATTGIAGPNGGTDNKPVGTICIAVADNKTVRTKTFTFTGDRIRNIERGTYTALAELYWFIKETSC